MKIDRLVKWGANDATFGTVPGGGSLTSNLVKVSDMGPFLLRVSVTTEAGHDEADGQIDILPCDDAGTVATDDTPIASIALPVSVSGTLVHCFAPLRTNTNFFDHPQLTALDNIKVKVTDNSANSKKIYPTITVIGEAT